MTKDAGVPIHETETLEAGGRLIHLGGARPMTLRLETLEAFSCALDAWEKERGLRWIAFQSAHPTTFLAGADFSELAALDAPSAAGFSRRGQALFERMRRSRLWLVALVEGACMGGGLDFILSCDYRIAGKKARFAHPGPKLGFLTGWGGTAVIPRLGGAGAAALLEARTFRAEEARKAGWIDEVSAAPLRRAKALARRSKSVDLTLAKEMLRLHGLSSGPAMTFAARLAQLHDAVREEETS
ncbi:MAG: enoyl-CoA hydratase/isomerase family protein [Acidobacteriota bacterium]|jgi:3-hydroxyacyl-CoA dehydrogenase / enoyl-CoA hydratase / 3-hydroxybutyryl-CoA epimerase